MYSGQWKEKREKARVGGKVNSFRDLIVWQRANELAKCVFILTDRFPKKYLYDLTSQLRRAALSVPTNIAEGCASEHSGELLQFLNIAYRSLSETEYLVEFALSMDLLSEADFKKIQALCTETGRMLNALSSSIKSKKASAKNKN